MYARQQAHVGRLDHASESSSMCTAAMSQGHAAHCCNVLNCTNDFWCTNKQNLLTPAQHFTHLPVQSKSCVWPSLRWSITANLMCHSPAGTQYNSYTVQLSIKASIHLSLCRTCCHMPASTPNATPSTLTWLTTLYAICCSTDCN